MRHLAAFVALSFGLLTGSAALSADAEQSYPSKPIKLVVPFPPGGATDAIARVVSTELSKRLAQPIVVDNRPGAGGNIAAEQVAKSTPDGYTLLLGTISTNAINESLYRSLSFSASADLKAVAPLASLPLVLVTSRPDIASVDDLTRAARRSPGGLTYGSPGNGTSQHLAAEIFQRLTQTKLTHVPYKGSGAALTDVMGGRVDVIFETVVAALPHIRSGRLKALAVTTPEPVPFMSDVPTFAKAGVPGLSISAWNGVFAPKEMPDRYVSLLNVEIRKVLADPEVKQRLVNLGGVAMTQDAKEFTAFIRSERDKYRELIQGANITVE